MSCGTIQNYTILHHYIQWNTILMDGHPVNMVTSLLQPLIFVLEKCQDNTFSYQEPLDLIQPPMQL
jgi:hypothetical protein